MTVKGKTVRVDDSGILALGNLRIESIKEIEGLETLSGVRELYLDQNRLTRIQGLDGASLNHSRKQVFLLEMTRCTPSVNVEGESI